MWQRASGDGVFCCSTSLMSRMNLGTFFSVMFFYLSVSLLCTKYCGKCQYVGGLSLFFLELYISVLRLVVASMR